MPGKKISQESQVLRIDYAEEDINYYNGFRYAVMLIKNQMQYLWQALNEVPEEKLRDTVKAWSNTVHGDMQGFAVQMYGDLKNTYCMALRKVSRDGYYIMTTDAKDKN